MTVIGLLQFLSLLDFFGEWVSYLVPRASGAVIGGTRGVTLLASEPSRASIHYIIVYFILREFYIESPSKRLYGDLFVIMFLLLVIKAASALPFLLIFILYTWFTSPVRAVCTIIAAVVTSFSVESRMAEVVNLLLSNGSNLFEAISLQSGFRYLSVYLGYSAGFNYPLGWGVGNWFEGYSNALSTLSVSETMEPFLHPVRPTSFFASLSLDVGFVGVSVFILCFVLPLRGFSKFILHQMKSDHIVAASMFSLLFLGDVGDPVVWVAMGFSYTAYRDRMLRRPVLAPIKGLPFTSAARGKLVDRIWKK
jgi:hypothetical protein